MNMNHQLGTKLPLVSGGVLHVSGTGERLDFLIEPLSGPMMVSRIGAEIVVGNRFPQGGTRVVVTKGHRFHAPGGGYITGGRYLAVDPKAPGEYIAAISYTLIERDSKSRHVVLSNIYTAPSARNRGLATALLDAISMDHPTLTLDASLTEDGARFFGYKKAAEPQVPAKHAGVHAATHLAQRSAAARFA